jgi:prepilin-type N-terminal cleavage/methylation domain-containing protein
LQVPDRNLQTRRSATVNLQPSTFNLCCAFTLVEVLVVITLLSLIVLALMAVFNSTQAAFRASVTQTDVLQSGRTTMDLISEDLREMSPSSGTNNGPVNFYVNTNLGYASLLLPLVASSQLRTNVLENFFILSRENQTWTGTGYVVDQSSSVAINPLYRFSMSTNVAAAGPVALYNVFANEVNNGAFTNMSHLVDGVMDLRARAYDTNGVWINASWPFFVNTNADNIHFFISVLGETGLKMFSNTLPAAVEVQMGVLEDRTLQRAESLSGNFQAQSNYIAQQAGKVHVFRQRVSIPNVDPVAYQ